MTTLEKRQPKASVKLKDDNNQSEPQIKSHQHVCDATLAVAKAAKTPPAVTPTLTASMSTSTSHSRPTAKRKQPPPEVTDSDGDPEVEPDPLKGKFTILLCLDFVYFNKNHSHVIQKNSLSNSL